ncbi:amidohydrolase family protein [Ferruginibacter lapsinanis]|uniref:amidohydrolase family protein n=1 Tax=Ferruginibacter lapsinanis TaxID=563172 RepID=UPI001E61C34B|nr:amidohydrolase family protein [Ferruginibacter lapsinanis]UEG50232.1 amidohydrolase family protein [Ferruginibacter lapsinanis]
MKKSLLALVLLPFFATNVFSQLKFSDETKKYIEYSDSVIAFKNALLIDGTGNAAKSHQTVIIVNGKINWIGDDVNAIIPKVANTIDLNGKALMPGLVMLHEHMYISAPSMETRQYFVHQLPATFPRLYLAAGATTIRTAGNIEPYSDINLKKDIDAGKIPGPSIEATAPYMEGNQSPIQQMNRLDKPADAVSFVNYWADQGFTSFKGYMFIDKPTLRAAIEAAHKRKLKVTAHLCAVTYREAAEMGIDQLEHGFFASTDFVTDKKENQCPANADEVIANLNVESDSVKNLLQLLVDKKVIITSTLAVFEGFTTTQPAPTAELLNYFSPDSRDFYLKLFARIKSGKAPSDDDRAFVNNAKMEKLFYTMGGLLTVGTDPTGNGGTIAGFGNWRAIELLVESDGFTPLEAIKIATLNGAIALGFNKNIGTIETGKNADLLIIDGDPSKNISDIRKVQFVFKKGVGYNSRKLFESVKGKVGFN